MTPRIYRIIRKREETSNTFTITLSSSDHTASTPATPGQFNMLYTFGVGEAPISFSGDTDNKEEIVHTIRYQGAVTTALGKLDVGDCVGIRGPFGCGWPLEQARRKDVIIMAGGIGLAPLMPVMHSLLSNGRTTAGKAVSIGSIPI